MRSPVSSVIARVRRNPLGGLIVAGLLAAAVAAPALSEQRIGPDRPTAGLSFENLAGELGMADFTRTWGSAWADVNRDGRPELFVGRHWRPPRLFRGTSGEAFEEVFPQAFQGVGTDRHGCVWGEATGDGKADLYCVRGADKGDGSGANQLFLNQGRLSFINAASGSGTSNPAGRGRTANWIDFDLDGDLDLFIGNQMRRGHPNLMLRNERGRFAAADVGVDDELETSSSSWADFDDDGDPDLLVLQRHGDAALYRNVGGTFERMGIPEADGPGWVSGAWGDQDADGLPDLHLVSEDEGRVLRNTGSGFEIVHRQSLVHGRMSAWFDVDNDADLDLYVVQGAAGRNPGPGRVDGGDVLVLNLGDRFERASIPSARGATNGNGESVSVSDHDRDGRQDLFVTNGTAQWLGPNVLLRNVSDAADWIAVELRGDPSNPFGFGARVTIDTGDRELRHQVTDSVTARGQNEVGYLHVGLGKATSVSIEVAWGDGASDCVTSPAGRVVSIVKGASGCS